LPKALEGLRPTALVHAAGLMRGNALGALNAEAGRTLWRLHVEAAFLLADALVPRMPDGVGRVAVLRQSARLRPHARSQHVASPTTKWAALARRRKAAPIVALVIRTGPSRSTSMPNRARAPALF
jgi:hypothetical protein